MKYYLLTIHKTSKRDKYSNEEIMPVIETHLEYLKNLARKGKCVLAGTFSEYSDELGTGCYLFVGETEAEIIKLANSAPLVREKIFSYQIHSFQIIIPE